MEHGTGDPRLGQPCIKGVEVGRMGAMTSVLITGANKGIGREVAGELAALGWTVWLGARQPDQGQAAVDELVAGGADARFVPIDVTDDASVAAAVATVVAAAGEHSGALDVLVNNAGIIGSRQSVLDTTASDFLACYGVNLLGPVRVTHAFLPLLSRSDHPRVVMVSSGVGSFAATGDPSRVENSVNSLVYPSSKAALNMVTTQYARALPDWKINAVDPGYTATDLNGHSGTQTVAEAAKVIVRLATVGPEGPTGAFFDNAGPAAW
jgi:NAD(P)-dependent dehydrogenase (short-subunit alcohol dehydrogenase family)